MVSGVETIEAALNGMRAIRDELTAAGLPVVFEVISWPGLKPGDFQRQREAFQYKVELSGLAKPSNNETQKMENAVKDRGGVRKGLFVSYEAWLKAGKPAHYVFDSRTGEGHVKTAEERRLDEVKDHLPDDHGDGVPPGRNRA